MYHRACMRHKRRDLAVPMAPLGEQKTLAEEICVMLRTFALGWGLSRTFFFQFLTYRLINSKNRFSVQVHLHDFAVLLAKRHDKASSCSRCQRSAAAHPARPCPGWDLMPPWNSNKVTKWRSDEVTAQDDYIGEWIDTDPLPVARDKPKRSAKRHHKFVNEANKIKIKSNKYVPLVPAPSKESMHEVENLVVLRNNTKKVIFRFITHHMVPVVK